MGGRNSHKVLGCNLDSSEPPSDPQPQRAQDFQRHRKGLSRQLKIIPNEDSRSCLPRV